MDEIKKFDLELYMRLEKERLRQFQNIELIASENIVSKKILALQGSVLTNKYAEGFPGKRYYGGCEFVDEIENLAIERAKKLFSCNYANVQPHSGSQANFAVYFSVLNPGDTALGMDLSSGGHLTHGSSVNFSGKLYNFISYGLDKKTHLIDYDQVYDLSQKHKPKMIVAGASAYPRIIDFKRFREIADSVGAVLFVDMAHIAGLVAAGLHPSPFPYADFVASTTHKTLRGPRGAMILTQTEENSKKINGSIFPGIQGGPLMHVIAAKAMCFKEAMEPSFKEYQKNVLNNAKIFADLLQKKGFDVVSGGTDNHLFLVSLLNKNITGKKLEEALDKINITLNKNSVPNDPAPPFVTSGVRIGTPCITTRKMGESEIEELVDIIDRLCRNIDDLSKYDFLKQEVLSIASKFPLEF